MEAILTVNGQAMEIAIASTKEDWGENWRSQIFHDDEGGRFESITEELDKSNFFQLSWNDVNDNLVSVSCNTDCIVIVVAWEYSGRQDTIISILEEQDWILKEEQHVTWVDSSDWRQVYYGESRAVLSKNVEAGNTLSFNRPANNLPITVFVVQGKKLFVLILFIKNSY